MQAPFVEVVPQQARGDVPQRIGEIVGHHLRLARRSRREIHHHDVVVGVRPLRTHERFSPGNALVKVEKARGNLGAHAYQHLRSGAFGHGRRDMVGDDRLARRHDRLDPGHVAAVNDVLLGQQVGRGNHHRPQLVQREDREPEFVAAFENQHHRVALADAEAPEPRGRAVALAFEVGEGELNLLALVVGPQQGLFVGLLRGIGVNNVVGEIEIFGNADMQVPAEILLRRKGGLR